MPGAKSQRIVRSINPCLHQRLLMMAPQLLGMSQKSRVQPYALGGGCIISQEMLSEMIPEHLSYKAEPLLDHPTVQVEK